MLDRHNEFPGFTEWAPSGPTSGLTSAPGPGIPTAVCEGVSSGTEDLEGWRYFLSFLNRSILWWDATEKLHGAKPLPTGRVALGVFKIAAAAADAAAAAAD